MFLAELRALADKCDFGDQLNTSLRDRLIVGINDTRMQRRLLAEHYHDLTLEKVMDVCIAMEAAGTNVQSLQETQGRPAATSINTVPSGKANKGRKTFQANKSCMRCGSDAHSSNDCKHKTTKCNFCSKIGHLERVCMTKQRQGQSQGQRRQQGKNDKRVHQVEMTEEQQDLNDDILSIINRDATAVPPITHYVVCFGRKITMEIDTGVPVSVINQATYDSLRARHPTLQLSQPERQLTAYGGLPIDIIGQVTLPVIYKQYKKYLTAFVAAGQGPNLLGRQWLRELQINTPAPVNAIGEQSASAEINKILAEYTQVFGPDLGKYKGPEVHLHVNPQAQPRFCKARPVPFAIKDKVESEIDRLVKAVIYRPVPYSEWAAPLVPVLKGPDKQSVRLCGDYKITANKAIMTEQYTMPTIEEIFSRLAGAKYFVKLDMSEAYAQLPLDAESQELVTVNTTKGLFAVTRLSYGVSSAPMIFQRTMDSLLGDIEGTSAYIDDVLVTGRTEAELCKRLRMVLKRLSDAGLRCRKEKCIFNAKSVTYLGYVIDANGLHPTNEKVKAITEAPTPVDATQLRSWIRLVLYYASFIADHATKLAPLHALLRKNATWRWTDVEEAAF